VNSASAATGILAANRIPTTVLMKDGDTVAVRMEHCWVDALLEGTRWVALDPSFRRYSYSKGPDVSSSVPFDEGAYLGYLGVRNRMVSILPIMRTQGAPRKGVPPPSRFYLDAIEEFLQRCHPESSLSCGYGTRISEPVQSDVLEDKLPFSLLDVQASLPEIPDSLRHRIVFEVCGPSGSKNLRHIVSTPDLGTEPVLFYYLPATEDDHKLAEAYGNMYRVPAYLMDVCPVLRIGGRSVATGGPIQFGGNQILEIAFLFPTKGEIDRVRMESVAGVVRCPVFDLQRTCRELASPYIDDMERNDEDDYGRIDPSVPDAAWIERYLHGLGMWFFQELDECDHLLRRVLHVTNTREPSLAVLGIDTEITYLFGVPYNVDPSGKSIDTYRILNKPFSLLGDTTKSKVYNLVSGFESSFLMQDVWEYWRGTNGFSAIELLQVAKQRRIPVYAVSSDNIDSVDVYLRLTDEAMKRIRDLTELGVTVIVPRKELVVGKWQGIGYIAMNPSTGDAAYKVRTEREAFLLPPGSVRLIFEYTSVLLAAVAAAVATHRVRRRRRDRLERERRRIGGPPSSQY
jgi:hypothetical protein